MNEHTATLGSGTLPDFRALFEGSPNLYLVLDPNLVIVAVNDAYCAATMTLREQIVFRHLFDVFPDNPDDANADGVSNLRASLMRALRNRRPDLMPTQKYDIPRPDGTFEERHWSPLNSPVLGQHGEVLWIIHRVEDVTEQVRSRAKESDAQNIIAQLTATNAELARRNRENAELQRDLVLKSEEIQSTSTFLNLIVENIPAMVAVKDAADLRFVLLNRHGEELTGISREESLGKNDYDFFSTEQADFFARLDRETLASGELKVIPEERIDTRHKGVRTLRTHKLPVPDEHGRPKYLLAMSEDITDRINAERALRYSEALSSGLMRASPDAIMAVDASGRIILASDRFRSMFGYEPEALIGQPANILIPPDQHQEQQDRARKALESGTGTVEDLVGLRRDGTTFPVEASLSGYRSDRGPLVVISLRDISDRKAVEVQLRQAQKMEAIGNLTGGLAHDFNNLLSVVIGNLDLLREDLSSQPAADALAHEALESALRGAELTKRLLAFARRQPLQPRTIDVNDLVAGISKLLSRTMGDNIQIRLQPGYDVAPVTVDPAQLENCLVNLVANARDAMPRGGELTISTDNRNLDEDYVSLHPGLAAGEYTLIEVADTGSGMPPEVMEKIFEPFFTTKREGKGTGLGLAMVFGFMKQSGGHINVYSEQGVGTTFRLYLPHADAAVETTSATLETLNLGGPETILAVEDNPRLRALVVKQLTAMGYRCFEAETGPEALAVLERETVDLLFTDVIMPGGMSGYELGREAKTRWPDIKVLLTSGFPEEHINGNGQPPWNMRLLTKPYRKEDLARTLREVLTE
jgi:PAS domain S-box-containing protein